MSIQTSFCRDKKEEKEYIQNSYFCHGANRGISILYKMRKRDGYYQFLYHNGNTIKIYYELKKYHKTSTLDTFVFETVDTSKGRAIPIRQTISIKKDPKKPRNERIISRLYRISAEEECLFMRLFDDYYRSAL